MPERSRRSMKTSFPMSRRPLTQPQSATSWPTLPVISDIQMRCMFRGINGPLLVNGYGVGAFHGQGEDQYLEKDGQDSRPDQHIGHLWVDFLSPDRFFAGHGSN